MRYIIAQDSDDKVRDILEYILMFYMLYALFLGDTLPACTEAKKLVFHV